MLNERPNDEFDPNKPMLVFMYSFLNGIVLYGYLIPISLYVSVEIAKATQVSRNLRPGPGCCGPRAQRWRRVE